MTGGSAVMAAAAMTPSLATSGEHKRAFGHGGPPPSTGRPGQDSRRQPVFRTARHESGHFVDRRGSASNNGQFRIR